MVPVRVSGSIWEGEKKRESRCAAVDPPAIEPPGRSSEAGGSDGGGLGDSEGA